MTRAGEQIVITGSGLVCPLGLTREDAWEAVRSGRCGVGPMSAMELPLPAGADGGQAPDLPDDFEPNAPREVRYLRWALLAALRDAGIDAKMPYPPRRCGIVLGTTLHGMRGAGQFLRDGNLEHLRDFLATSTIARAARDIDAQGLAVTTCSACSSSLGSIALAITLLQSGELDLVVAGGYDPISEYAYGGFNSLRLVSPTLLRPFAHDRAGMKLAEGYGIIVLERASDAHARGAKPAAAILGFGESADAHHLTQPHPEGDGAARAMHAAIACAGLSADQIDLVAAHATGTPDNDAAEYAALSRVFGAHLPHVPVVAFKSHLGHTLGGAGAVELILSMMAMRDQVIPSCANVRQADVAFDGLRLTTDSPRNGNIAATLNTSLGFGGANTCVILGTPPVASRSAVPTVTDSRLHDVLITGIGIVLPNAIGREAFVKRLTEPSERITADTGAIDESAIAHLLNARRVRRMSDYVKLTLAATALALDDAKLAVPLGESFAAILGSTHGSANYSSTYYRQIVEQGLIGANPMLFAEGVPNAAAAHLSLMLSITGACQTVIGSRTAGLDALRLAAVRIATGQWDRAMVSAGEEYCDMVNAAYRHCGHYAGRGSAAAFEGESGFAAGAGAITLVLESRHALERRGGTAHGRILTCAASRNLDGSAADAARHVLEALGPIVHLFSSANATVLDRAESAAARKICPDARITSLYGRFPELFSVMPLTAIAAGLLAPFSPNHDEFAILCTDYHGLAAGARIARCTSNGI